MPRKIKMRREGDGGAVEEYFDYVFPDDEKKLGACFGMCSFLLGPFVTLSAGSSVVGMKILEKAMEWKKLAAAAASGMGMGMTSTLVASNSEELSIDDVEEVPEKAPSGGSGGGKGEVEGGVGRDEGDAEAAAGSLLGKRKSTFDESSD